MDAEQSHTVLATLQENHPNPVGENESSMKQHVVCFEIMVRRMYRWRIT